MPPPQNYTQNRPQEAQTVNAALMSTLNRAVDDMQFNANRLGTASYAPPPPPLSNYPNYQTMAAPSGPNYTAAKSPRVAELLTPRHEPVITFMDSPRPSETKNTKANYAAELREQMALKKQQKAADRDKWAKMDEKLARECAEFDPWGKAGAGAPLRGKDGKPISDLRHMKARNDRNELEADVSIDFKDGVTPRPGSTVLEDVRNEMLRHGVTKITDMYEPKRKVDTSYRAYLEEEIEKKERLKREKTARQKESDELEEKRIKQEQLKLKLEADREKQREMEKNIDAKEQNKLLMEKKKLNEENHIQHNEPKIKLKRHKVLNLDPDDWSQKQAELDAKIRVAQDAMTARSDGKSVVEQKQHDQLRQTGHDPVARTPAKTDMRGRQRGNDLKLDLSRLHDEPQSEAAQLKFNTQKVVNDTPYGLIDSPVYHDKRLIKTQKATRAPSRTSLIIWDDETPRKSPPNYQQNYHRAPHPPTAPPPVYHGTSLVNAKIDELRRRLEHQSLRLQHRVEHGYVRPSSPPRLQIHRGANAITTMTEATVQKDISTMSFGLQQAPHVLDSHTQTPVPTQSQSMETDVITAERGHNPKATMTRGTVSHGPLAVLPKKANKASLAKRTFTSISTGTYEIESDDAQIVVDDYVEAAEMGPRDLSPDALMQIPNDDIDIFNAKLNTETNIVPALDAPQTPSRNSLDKSSRIDLPANDNTDDDASPIKETLVSLPIKDANHKTTPRKSVKDQSKIPRPAAHSPAGNVSSGSDFDFMRAFKSRNKERLYKLKTFNDEYPSERNLLSRRERRKPGTSGRLMPAKASRPATVLLPKF